MEQSERILILEDDVAYAKELSLALSSVGVSRFTSYPERLPEIIREFDPTLLIVDYNLNHPTINGIKATRLVRQNAHTNFLPILLLSGEDDMSVIEEAYKSGIDDYVLKPVSMRFLRAKIENMLFQTRKKVNAQALSGLPGNAAIEAEFYQRLQRRRRFSIAYTDLDNFKPFNDEKGVKRGDEAIQMLAQILYDLRSANSRDELFIGHLGGDDFFLMGGALDIENAVRKAHRTFLKGSKAFFEANELKRGYYHGTDRDGKPCKFPLLTISTAILNGVRGGIVANFEKLAEHAARAKKAAKKSRNKIISFEVADLVKKSNETNLTNRRKNGAKKKSKAKPKKAK
jgi:PleD family two-component response regulator